MISATNPMLIFGCGNMGRAMLDGWLRGGIDPASFVVADPMAKDLPSGVRRQEGSETFATAMIAIKPQMFAATAAEIAPLLAPGAVTSSVMAGITAVQLTAHFPAQRIVRLMPNLAAAIGKSPLGLWEASGDAALRDAINALLSPLGTPAWLSSEAQMDAVTALAGSGPAFVYRFIDALAKAGEQLDLEPALAAQLAMAMVDGATQLAATSDASPAELAARVTSPGGTTAAGLAVLDESIEALITETIMAARDRGAELAKPS
jgi:pyrroline-5-carboxylate reductase